MTIPEPGSGLLIPVSSGIVPRDVDRYSIYIGNTKIRNLPYYYNPFAPVNPMFAILGSPGYGKSELLMNLILRLKMRNPIDPPVIIIDPQGEYKRVLSHLARLGIHGVELRVGVDSYLNIFDSPEGVSYQFWVSNVVVPSIREALNIAPGQAARMDSLMKKIIFKVYHHQKGYKPSDPSTWREVPTLLDVVREIRSEIAEEEQRREQRRSRGRIQSLNSLYDRLGRWVFGIGTDYFSRAASIPIAQLLNIPVTVINVKHLEAEARNLVILYIFNVLYQLMKTMLPVKNTIRVVFIVDEGWILLKKTRSGESPLEILIRQARKYGFMVGVATQKFDDLSETILSLVGTLFIFNPNDPKVVDYAKKAGVPEKTAKEILNLERGWCLVRSLWATKTNVENPNAAFFVKVDSEVDPGLNIVSPRTTTPTQFVRLSESMALINEFTISD
ncbi:MAG: ATP-binding protein [Sulfolobales archaeon]